jgi:hypothetical protein
MTVILQNMKATVPGFVANFSLDRMAGECSEKDDYPKRDTIIPAAAAGGGGPVGGHGGVGPTYDCYYVNCRCHWEWFCMEGGLGCFPWVVCDTCLICDVIE